MVLSIYGVNYQNNDDFPMTGSIMLLKVGGDWFNRGAV